MTTIRAQNGYAKKSRPNFKESIAGYAVGNVASLASIPVGTAVVSKMSKMATSLNPTEISTLNQASETILNTTGLKSKGVEIANISGLKNLTKLPDKILEFTNPVFATSNGKNAFFTDKEIAGIIGANKIGINKQKLPTAVFHEIGHALNYNKSGFWKTMQKLRTPGMLITSGLLLFNVLTKKTKPKEGQELSKGQKIKNWVRDKSGFLAFGAMVPMLAEEAAASIKGCKEAKKILDPNLYKKVAKTNKVAYISYLATAVVAGLSVLTAKKVKDKLVEKKEAKLEQKRLKAMHA